MTVKMQLKTHGLHLVKFSFLDLFVKRENMLFIRWSDICGEDKKFTFRGNFFTSILYVK